jgi:hypothetical protein
MNVEMLIKQVAASNGWAIAAGPQGGYRLEIPTEYGRSQVVNITGGDDPDGRPLAWIWSKVTDIANVGDPWYLLGLNAQLAYGALAVRDRDVIVVETQLLGTADYEELRRAIFYVAKYADDLEKQVHGNDDRH